MYGHVVQGLLQGFEPFGARPGFMSVRTRICLRFFARLLTTRSWKSVRYCSSPVAVRMRLLEDRILLMGGLFGL